MKYDKFCSELESHFAAIQKLINKLKPDYDNALKSFDTLKEEAIVDCMDLEQQLKVVFEGYMD